ncbi:alpha/beta hydrolase [Marmoricola sp. URHB0036]|uniref:alpha/beta hydrolase n=1 Tax=Marmoricola sp. URHB0036 TaxID=1298863 RepID=UPI0004214FE1|nr:alpha/beta hydrolase [Marmoricola sp. URHB0036]
MPRLLDQAQALVIRTAMNLPARVQRALNRRPVLVDGLELSPEVQLMLTLKRLARVPAAETLPVAQARIELSRQQWMVGGRQTVGALRDLEVDGAEGPLRARLYIPTERTGPDPAPTMLFIHGGGWMYGDLESHDPTCRFLAERSGVQILAIDYRLAPEHKFPAAVEDCQAAYRWLVDHADDVNADPARLAVGGDSAGGSLSLSTAVWAAEKGLPLAFQLLIYPGADFVERTESRRLFGEGFVLTEAFMSGAEEAYFTPDADKGHPDASGLRRVDFPAGLAPAHVVTAGYDPLRDEGEALVRLLAENGVTVDHKRYPSMIHGFVHLVGAGHEGPAYNQEIAERLRRALA